MDQQEPIDPKIKLEPPEDTWNDRKIKLEPLEIEKEELLDWPPKLERMDYPLKLLEPKLEEPDHPNMDRLLESEYPDYLKLEPVEEPDNNSRRNLHSSSSISTRQTPFKRKCSVCSKFEMYKNLTQIKPTNRRLVLMVGLVLKGRKTVEEARWLMSLCQLIACRNHVCEAIHAIYEALKIENIHELKTRSTENMGELMNTVNSIGSERMDFDRFEQLLIDMVWRTDPVKGDIEKPVQQSAFPSAVEKQTRIHAIFGTLNIKNIHELRTRSTENSENLLNTVNLIGHEHMLPARFDQLLVDLVWRTDSLDGEFENLVQQSAFTREKLKCMILRKPKQRECSMCMSLENEEKTVNMNLKNKRLVILIEAVISGKMTLESARIAYFKEKYRVCKSHLSEVFDSIMKRLNIEKIEDFWKCPWEDMWNLIAIAQKLNRSFTATLLYKNLIYFDKICDRL